MSISTGRRPYRVLLIAEAANPEWTSVPLGGWSLSRALAKITDAHMVTQIRNRDALIRAGLKEGSDFTTIDNERIAAPLSRFSALGGEGGLGWTTTMALSSFAYYSFEREFWHIFGRRIEAREFDIVHRITPKSPTTPSIVAKRVTDQGVPFVLGPLGGGLPWPKGFSDRRHGEREWLSYVRWAHKLMPGYRSTRQYSSAIIAGSKFNLEEMPKWAREKCVYIPGNGVDPERFPFPRDRVATPPLRAAFVGRLVPLKCGDLLLEGAAEFLANGKLELHFIGDGPQRAYLEQVANNLGIQRAVTFHGWLPHREIEKRLRVCDFTVLPSIHEFGGAVVVESMAVGVTPVVANYGGPPEFIDDKTGIRVSFSDRRTLVEGIKQTIAEFVRNPGMLDTMGKAARQKVFDKLTWDAKAKQVLRIYDAISSGVKDLRPLSYL